MKRIALACLAVLCGCATGGPTASVPFDTCRAESAEIVRLNAQLAAEAAERQRITRAASRREEALQKQLEAMKSIERGILERDDRMRTETR